MQEIRNLVQNLRLRKTKRSLNFIGTAWKWIAGNPDHEDYITIKEKINNILQNNNRQVVINQLYNEKLNQITNVTNRIQQLLRQDTQVTNNIILEIQFKLHLIKEELRNINHAIHWAKLGVVNSLILSKKEIEISTNVLDKEMFTYPTIEEALNFSEVKIITNDSVILYIVNIPLTTRETYQTILLKPIKKIKYITEIPYNKIIKNENEIYGIIGNCKNYNFINVCKSSEIIDISKTSCIPNLLKSANSTCNIVNNQHVPTTEEIAPGVLFLNQFSGSVQIGNSSYNLNGTFLIKYRNISIMANGRNFTSSEISTTKILPAILQPTPVGKEYRQLLSLEMINELHINNTHKISLIQAEQFKYSIATFGTFSIFILIFSIFIIRNTCKNNKQIRITTEPSNFPQPTIPPNLVKIVQHETLQSTLPEAPQFNNIPYF